MSSWTNQPPCLNSSFPRIADPSLPSVPASRPVSQDTLRTWERAARDQSYMCNQAAGFSRCLTKVQDSMASQLRLLQSDKGKGKSTGKTHQAIEELIIICTMCMLPSVRACVTQFSLKLPPLHIFGKLLVLMNLYTLGELWSTC